MADGCSGLWGHRVASAKYVERFGKRVEASLHVRYKDFYPRNALGAKPILLEGDLGRGTVVVWLCALPVRTGLLHRKRALNQARVNLAGLTK